MRLILVISIFIAVFNSDLEAAHYRDGGFIAHKGILESIRLKPRLPGNGEGFTVNLSGNWPEAEPDTTCLAPLDFEEVVVYEGNRVQIISFPKQDPEYCDQPPASWNFDVSIPATAWQAVNEDGYLLVEHMLFSGPNVMTGIKQVFDMRFGSHEVPAFIGSGFWISADLPNEGILVEQQGDRVLFYGLGYDRDISFADNGEPVWQLIAGDMYGDSALGRSYRYDWPFDDSGLPVESPKEEELLTMNDSGSIIVNDYNHIRVFTQVSGTRGLYHDYKRFSFGVSKSRLPVYAPPMDGRWTLHGFNNQNQVFTTTLELLQGSSPELNQFRFKSVSDDWLAICDVIADGTGNCRIEQSSDGAKFDFPLSEFQGNLARGRLQLESDDAIDAILVRKPWGLPVLDNQ